MLISVKISVEKLKNTITCFSTTIEISDNATVAELKSVCRNKINLSSNEDNYKEAVWYKRKELKDIDTISGKTNLEYILTFN